MERRPRFDDPPAAWGDDFGEPNQFSAIDAGLHRAPLASCPFDVFGKRGMTSGPPALIPDPRPPPEGPAQPVRRALERFFKRVPPRCFPS